MDQLLLKESRLRPSGLLLMFALGLLATTVGCGDDDENPPIYYEAGTKLDGKAQYDILPHWDLPAKLDQGGDGQPSDGGVKKDGTEGCEEPADVTCSETCGQEEICTAASGGTCTPVYTIQGVAGEKEALLGLAKAIGDCYLVDPSEDTLCGTLDTCGLEGDILKDALFTWVCDQSQISDFDTAAQRDAAKEVLGCGPADIEDMDWQVTAVSGGEKGKICLTYNYVVILGDEIVVGPCEGFPL